MGIETEGNGTTLGAQADQVTEVAIPTIISDSAPGRSCAVGAPYSMIPPLMEAPPTIRSMASRPAPGLSDTLARPGAVKA